MKILLAPSETKRYGGDISFKLENLLFPTLFPYRKKLLHTYMNILQKSDMKVLSTMFGLKKEIDIQSHIKDIIHEPAMKAIERYTGVAFDYLGYINLSDDAQHYIDNHVILCSNLFGFLRADDLIPEYRLKQGVAVGEIKVEKFYHEHGSLLMEAYLEDEEILDLRAGFYDKFYRPTKPYTTLKFIKEGKVVSHWAKAYRGLVLREIAKTGVKCIDAFMHLPIEGLRINEIQIQKNRTEIIYDIEL
ncbi:MAG: YaaA family protein [Sulfurovum sp.]|nr:YaaA family protein [Sulfurovum sp.]MCB4765563.1 YaaA family protein [Sulfurovum sp.]MCB4775201.1 YaaA family protein [Sulfurovum sp.]MCB4776719.1 YaaA family protein [Sulfurovum sp.]